MSPAPTEGHRDRRLRETEDRLRRANARVDAYLSRLYEVRARLETLEQRAAALAAEIESEQMRDSIISR